MSPAITPLPQQASTHVALIWLLNLKFLFLFPGLSAPGKEEYAVY